MMGRLAWALALAALGVSPTAAQSAGEAPEVRFAVLGHIRGDADGELNPRLVELWDRVRRLHPDFVVLTGDIIWGDFGSPIADPAVVERQWAEVDAALATLGVPVYRVPGNHDISDVGSRDVWVRRYGALPRAVTVGGVRLLLLSSAWIPADGDPRHHLYTRGVDLDPTQVRWLGAQLAEPWAGPTFAFMHHLLWWEEDDGRWWTEVHPLLALGGVQALFSGDYGPLKFSESPDLKVGRSSANRHNLRGASSPSVSE